MSYNRSVKGDDMATKIPLETSASEAVEYQKLVEESLLELNSIIEQIEKDQAETARLRQETKTLQAQLRTRL
jgi:hypothetical protein